VATGLHSGTPSCVNFLHNAHSLLSYERNFLLILVYGNCFQVNVATMSWSPPDTDRTSRRRIPRSSGPGAQPATSPYTLMIQDIRCRIRCWLRTWTGPSVLCQSSSCIVVVSYRDGASWTIRRQRNAGSSLREVQSEENSTRQTTPVTIRTTLNASDYWKVSSGLIYICVLTTYVKVLLQKAMSWRASHV
jgi:hypothetical protein